MKRALAVLLLLSQFSPDAYAANIASTDVSRLLTTPVGGTTEIAAIRIDDGGASISRLKRVEVYAPDAKIMVDTGTGLIEAPRSRLLHFVAVDSEGTTRFAFSIEPDGSALDGMLLSAQGRFSLRAANKDGGLEMIAERRPTVSPEGEPIYFACENDNFKMDALALPSRASVDQHFQEKATLGALRTAVIAYDTDTELFAAPRFSSGVPLTNVTNYLATLTNLMNVVYERDLDVTLQQGTTIMRNAGDPYTTGSGTADGEHLDEFGEEWFANQSAVSRAFAAHISGKSGSNNSASGIAWVLGDSNMCAEKGFACPNSNCGNCADGFCTVGHYSENRIFKFNGATVADDILVIAHELGHNFGASHTHCTDTSGSAGVQPIDMCITGAGSGCYVGATSCPSPPRTINGVTNVEGTLMSYCHIAGIGGCDSSEVFDPFHEAQLRTVATNNVNSGCFTVGGAGTITIADRTLGEATTPMNFTLTRSISTGAASVVATTVAGTATGGGTDYTNVSSQTVNFADGSLTATLNVTINNDAIDEDNETFVVNLTTPSAGYSITDAQATGTITDDDTTSISVNDPGAVVEGNPVNFTVTLSHANSRVVTVSRATADGTAAAPGDYTAVSAATLTFNPGGPLTQQVAVTTINDNLNEADSETFALNLSNVSATAVIGDSAGTGTISDNDATPTFSIADATPESENNANPMRFVITMSGPNQAAVAVTATTADGTATVADSDYQARSIAVNFASGVVSQNFDVTKFGDTKFEANETLAVNLTNATGGLGIGDSNATGTINNDDAGPVVSIADAARVEGNAGGGNMAFTISIPSAVGADAVVNFSTSPIDATPGVDYTATSGSATILAGATTGTLNINVFGDMTDEWDEQFRVTLTATASSTIGDGQAVGTISDDDAGELVYRNSFE